MNLDGRERQEINDVPAKEHSLVFHHRSTLLPLPSMWKRSNRCCRAPTPLSNPFPATDRLPAQSSRICCGTGSCAHAPPCRRVPGTSSRCPPCTRTRLGERTVGSRLRGRQRAEGRLGPRSDGLPLPYQPEPSATQTNNLIIITIAVESHGALSFFATLGERLTGTSSLSGTCARCHIYSKNCRSLRHYTAFQFGLNTRELCFCRWRTGPLAIPTFEFRFMFLALGP